MTRRPIELHYWPTANGRKISIALEEMQLPYVVMPVNILKGDQQRPEFLRISPNGRMPAIVDPDGPDGQPISIFESGAILQYLGRKTGQFYPQDERKRTNVDQWLFWQVAGLGPIGGQTSYFRDYAPPPLRPALERFETELRRLYGVLDRCLSNQAFVAGDYSIADMSIYGWVSGHKRQRIDLDRLTHVEAWLERVHSRPAVARGNAVGADLMPAHLNPSSPLFDPNAMKDSFLLSSNQAGSRS